MLTYARRHWRYLAVLTATILAGLGIGFAITDGDGDGTPDRLTLTVPTERPALLPGEFAAETGAHGHVHTGGLPAAQSNDIPGATREQEAGRRAASETLTADDTYDTSRVLQGAAAEPARLKCYTPMNGGLRPLSAIKLGVVHVTVSPNRPGLSDVLGLCGFFKRVKASPTWTVDNEGNSAENVPLERIPWTQAWYNRPSCSIEFVGSTGRPGEGAAEWTDAQYREGARLLARCFKLAGIKVQRGAVTSKGVITRAGVITHQELGRLGGAHTDPGPKFDMARFMTLVRTYAVAATAGGIPNTTTERRRCNALAYHRRKVRTGHGYWTPSRVRRARYLKTTLTRAGIDTSRCR